MDIYETRRAKLIALIGKKERGDIIAFANAHGLNESYLSQILNKHRRLGERAARNLEKQIGLPPFGLDSLKSSDPMAEIEAAINRADFLDEEGKKHWVGMLKSLQRKKS